MNIIELARKAGMHQMWPNDTTYSANKHELERFAALIRQQERERCAKVCDDWRREETLTECCDNAQHFALNECAAAIRGMKDE